MVEPLNGALAECEAALEFVEDTEAQMLHTTPGQRRLALHTGALEVDEFCASCTRALPEKDDVRGDSSD